MSNISLINASGSGNRMGQDILKQFMHIDGIAEVCLKGWDAFKPIEQVVHEAFVFREELISKNIAVH